MSDAKSRFPQAVFLRRANDTGYGFLYANQADFDHAVDSFVKPILRSFRNPPIPNQPDPKDHLKIAISTFLGQAFDNTIPDEVGAEGISRAAAAGVRQYFRDVVPAMVVIELRDSKVHFRPGAEFSLQPGYPQAIIVEGDAHGGQAHFFSSPEMYRRAGESDPDARSWLPQIIYRLYAQTPSVMIGRPLPPDKETGKISVECRGMAFGRAAPLRERGEI